jgi:hypothetical protein
MKQLEKILIPTDLSEHSRRAVVYGCWLATEQAVGGGPASRQ